jgi:hypothetical protein
MGLMVVTPPSTAGAAASPAAFTVELWWANPSEGGGCPPSSSDRPSVEVLSAFSTAVPGSATATMPFDTQSVSLYRTILGGNRIPVVCAWFYPDGAKANVPAAYLDEFDNVKITSFLFQYQLAIGPLVQIAFSSSRYVLFNVPPTGSTAPTTSNLIVDGDFSLPVVSGFETFYPLAKTTLPSAANSIHGWTVGANTVDLMGNAYWKPLPPGSPNDSQSVDLSGAAPGSITQTVSTTAGTSYLLTWWEAGNPQGGQPVKVMDVSWDKTSKAYPAPSTKGYSLGHMSWSQKSQVVVANSAQSVLEFADATPDQSAYGAVVADVSLTPDSNS